MAILDIVKEVITNKPVHLKSPYFIKADSDLKTQIEKLKEFASSVPESYKSKIEQDLKYLEAGRIGEEQVAYELKNSYLPILILHDLNLEFEGLSAQIDYLVITTKYSLVIECKNLFGNLEVNSNGDFIRTINFDGKGRKEGIYSPVTQNDRHLEMIKGIRRSSKGNFLTKAIFDKYFDENYKSVVVLANPKTVIDLKYAKKEIKNQIIRCDQLISYMKKLSSDSKNETYTEKHMYEMADFFMKHHTQNTTDYLKKYSIIDSKTNQQSNMASDVANVNIEETQIFKELREYRLETSRIEGKAAYMIFNNEQLKSMISIMPKTVADLKNVKGFDEVKCQKYGKVVLDIIAKYL